MTERLKPIYAPRKHLSVSTLLSYARCPRKYFYSKCGLREPDDALAPEYGTAMHAAIPAALETEDFTIAMAAFVRVWEPIEARMDEQGIEDPKRNRRTAERTIKHFIHTHKGTKSLYKLELPPASTIEKDDKASKFECPWAIDIGLRVPLVGWFDSFCRHRDTGGLGIVDFKTKSNWMGGLNARFFKAFDKNPQVATYSFVGETMMGEKPDYIFIEGILVDKAKVDNMTHPIAVPDWHHEDILRWLTITGTRLLAAEDVYLEALKEGIDGGEAVKAFEKDFTGCTPYPLFYSTGFSCEYEDLCQCEDYRALTGLFRIVPDHSFVKVTTDVDAGTS